MNKTQKNFWLDVIIFTAFTTIVTSSVGSHLAHHGGEGATVWGLTQQDWVAVHVLAGLVLTLCLALHLAWHWSWIKAAFGPTGKKKSPQLRRYRAVDVALFALFIPVLMWGLLLWPLSGAIDGGTMSDSAVVLHLAAHLWRELHAWGGVVLFFLVIVHLVQHRAWLATMVCRCFRAGHRQAEGRIAR